MALGAAHLDCLDRRELRRLAIIDRYIGFVGRGTYIRELREAGYPGDFGPDRHAKRRAFHAKILKWYRHAARIARPAG